MNVGDNSGDSDTVDSMGRTIPREDTVKESGSGLATDSASKRILNATTSAMSGFSECQLKYLNHYQNFEEKIALAGDLAKLDVLIYLDDIPEVDRLGVFTDFLKKLVAKRRELGEITYEAEYLDKYGKSLNHGVKDVFAIGLNFGDGFVGIGYIGEGGMGEIYLAKPVLDRTSKIKRAVKVTKNNKLKEQCKTVFKHSIQTFEEFTKEIETRFMREIEITTCLENENDPRKENIAKAYASGLTKNKELYLVLEYIDGWNLNDYQSAYNKQTGLDIPVGAWAYIFCEICKTLDFLHRHIVHRDLKPHNIMISGRDKKIKILDFGIAKFIESVQYDDNTVSNQTIAGIVGYKGTPNYSPIEQFFDVRSVDHRGDLFALGCTMFELLDKYGLPPFPVDIKTTTISRIINERSDAPIPTLKNDKCPDSLKAIVNKLLEHEVSKRVQSAGELARLLEPFQNIQLFENTIDVILGKTTEILNEDSKQVKEVTNTNTGVFARLFGWK